MLKNYFTVTLRNLLKNGVYSFINIAGLSIGLACSILILLWTTDELSWDGFHENKDHLYKVMINSLGDSEIYTGPAVPMPLWESLKTTPGVAKVAPTNWGQEYLVTVGENRLYKQGYYVGEDFLNMFSFKVLKGNADLKDPSSIVLTESAARSLFNTDDVLGKTVRVDDLIELKVSGVVEDVPGNSTFQFEVLIPFTTYMNRESWVKNSMNQWGNFSFNMYVQIENTSDISKVEEQIKDVIKKNQEGSESEVTFIKFEDLRLRSEFKNGKHAGSGNIVYVRLFIIIAVFILFIACINFMNLATARSEKRAKEVGIRKSIGSGKKELIFQFLGETFFIAFIAFILALAMVELSLPLYNGLVSKKLFIDYSNPLLWVVGVVVISVTGLVAGSYPAFYLSSFQPAAVLKGRMQTGKKGAMPRKIMVTVQFFASILLIICTLIIYKQIDHLKSRPVGYDQNGLISIPMTGDIPKNYKAIKQELLSSQTASFVTKSSSPITAIYSYMGDIQWQGKREDQRAPFATVATDYDYSKTMSIRLLEGRDFSEEYNDSLSMIVNKAAVDYMGLKNPLQEKLVWDSVSYSIIGVMENVIMNSPGQEVDPMMFIYNPEWYSDMTVRIHPNANVSDALKKMEEIYKAYNPNYPFTYNFVDDQFRRKFTDVERIGNLANLFATLAIIISCLGLFGLAAFMAEQRTKEIGIRKVLGASVSSVVMLLSKEFSVLILIAFILSGALGWYVMEEWLQRFPYRISVEWTIMAISGGLAFALAFVTVSYQAIKAATANPVKSLRSE